MPICPIDYRVKLSYNHRKGGETMPDYKEMYLIMMRAAEQAQNVLIEAQRKCEEMYVEADDQEE